MKTIINSLTKQTGILGLSALCLLAATPQSHAIDAIETAAVSLTLTASSTPAPALTANVTAIAAGDYHSLFVTSEGKLHAMGMTAYGQLGNGVGIGDYYGPDNKFLCEPNPVHVADNVATIASVSAGYAHSLFVAKDGRLFAMGLNDCGQLGIGTGGTYDTDECENIPKKVADNVASAAAGDDFSFYVTKDGKLYAMGYNGRGQLGNGTTTDSNIPVHVTTATTVATVAAGYSHCLFVTTNGDLYAMGANDCGQLGDGTTTDRRTPKFIASNVAAAAAGGSHSLYVKKDGTLYGFGLNDCGQLGDNTTINRATPVQIKTNVATMAAGGDHSLFVTTDGKLYAMGFNAHGQLGDGTAILDYSHNYDRHSPVLIDTDVVAVAAGDVHSLYTKKDGSLYAMGDNWCGQLGNGIGYGTDDYQNTPVLIVQGNAPAPGAPVITTHPASQTVTAGANVTFIVSATGNPAPTYQWQTSTNHGLNWRDITAADSGFQNFRTSELSLTAVTTTMNGTQYRCIATNPSGTATSNPATLTVNANGGGGSSGGGGGGGGAPSLLWLAAALALLGTRAARPQKK